MDPAGADLGMTAPVGERQLQTRLETAVAGRGGTGEDFAVSMERGSADGRQGAFGIAIMRSLRGPETAKNPAFA